MLLDISLELTRIVLISFMFFETIGTILNLLIFTRPTLLRSSCTLYLIAATIDHILVIYTTLLTKLFPTGFSDNISLISNWLCKVWAYLGTAFLGLSPYFFILTCFDRYCSSSRSATCRSWINKKIAKRLIIAAIILALVLYVHLAYVLSIESIKH